MKSIELLDNTLMEKSSKRVVEDLLEKYIKLGDNFTIENYKSKYGIVGQLTLKELPDEFFIDYIKTYKNVLTITNGPSYNFFNFYIIIYEDVLIKRRFNKILKIKKRWELH